LIVERIVQWGDCAPSGAVFYPNYYRWFDEATWAFFESRGMAIDGLAARYGNVGLPLMSCRAEFRRPCRLGDRLAIDVAVAELGADTVTLSFRIYNRGALAVRGEEVRFWGVRSETEPGRLRRSPFPPELAEMLTKLVAPESEERRWPAPG
jgi:4-hydroxybenzoyl-CoA thioesterase